MVAAIMRDRAWRYHDKAAGEQRLHQTNEVGIHIDFPWKSDLL